MRFSTLAMTALSCCSPIAAAAGLSKRAVAIGPGNGISVEDYLNCLDREVKDCKYLGFPHLSLFSPAKTSGLVG